MNKLGFGMMRLPLLDANDPATIDIEQVKKMVDLCFENGITYFDTAWMYHNFACQKAVKEVLTKRYPRESFRLATKFHSSYADDREGMEKYFNTQLQDCGVEYFDNYLLHGLNFERYEKQKRLEGFEWAAEKKAQGKVKKIGFSFHADADLLDKILTEHPEMEFVQLQLNYLDWDSIAIQAKRCYEVCVKHGKEVIVMEPVKGGVLANVPEDAEKLFKSVHPDWSCAEWALKYVAGLENVSIVLSGMSNLEQMQQNIKALEGFEKLDDKENQTIAKATEIIKAANEIPCTACSYCTPDCPQNIPIPKYFTLYNGVKSKGGERLMVSSKFFYIDLSSKFGKASSCLECGQCEGICPQGIPIIENLKKVAEKFE